MQRARRQADACAVTAQNAPIRAGKQSSSKSRNKIALATCLQKKRLCTHTRTVCLELEVSAQVAPSYPVITYVACSKLGTK